MQRYYFSAYLSAEQCLAYYRGEVRAVVVTADSGERVQFQFRHLQPYIDTNGVRGRFRLTVGENGAFIALEKIY